MDVFLLGAFLLMAALAILQAVLVTAQTYEHRRFALKRLGLRHQHRPSGRAALLIPCRGTDVELEDNLHALLVQDYDDYEVHFIVESEDDPACRVIRRVMTAHPEIDARIVVAGLADRSGQKVHNLRAATAGISRRVEYLAFVDSDARLSPSWLPALLSRLGRRGAGAATGYRWFVPKRRSLANYLLYSINCSLAVLLSLRGPNFVWGGSWAIRRDLFEWLGIRDQWAGTLSDDLVANRVLRRAGLGVVFEPAAMVASPMDFRLKTMISFVRRQYIIGRFYAPRGWPLALVLIGFSGLALAVAAAGTAWGLLTGSLWGLLPGSILAVLYAAGLYRGKIRRDLALVYFPHLQSELDPARRFDFWMGPLAGLVNSLLLVSSVVGRHITWRGITYRLYPGGRTHLVHREGEGDRSQQRSESARPATFSVRSASVRSAPRGELVGSP